MHLKNQWVVKTHKLPFTKKQKKTGDIDKETGEREI